MNLGSVYCPPYKIVAHQRQQTTAESRERYTVKQR